MEIYTLHITFPYDDEDEPWSKTIEVKENFSLQQLHRYIQKIVEFYNDHLYEFYLGKKAGNRVQSLPKKSTLNEIYPTMGVKLYYLFDFGDHWLFEIKKSRKKKEADTNIKYPRVIDSSGINPEQYPEYEED